ncbi:DUF2157 domain-containing protein [Desulfonema ishimotonii]|uniref:DUF2157 domain-containing protein n=1 Tax=Desulfonema ishimotonii TaxID=45657 RepID=A0A401FZR2_9BACT|nr:DUF2157 domain-containing protein [Desulfonema ishimotonii]GBC62423.1 DUF2157 domain-containing protein [Desulfonema ishimotonii]
MKLSKEDFQWAVDENIITAEQRDRLWEGLLKRKGDRPKFDMPHVLYYFGAMIVISAMTWFMTTAWEEFGGGGIFIISVIYALCFVLAGHTLWFRNRLKVPGGLLFTLAVCMTPLAIYGLERFTGIWPAGDPGTYHDYHFWIRGSWIFMEIGTVMAGLVALRFVRFPFLTAPIAFSLWYMSMDLTEIFFGTGFGWDERLWVSLWFGMAMLIFSYLIDHRTLDDYAFWGYLFGMLAFWGGLSLMKSDSELSKFFYCVINLLLMALSVFLQRRVFIIFGALGVFGYLGHLAYRVFEDSLLFPFALTLVGILIIFLGIRYQKKQERIEQMILSSVPERLGYLLPTNRRRRDSDN